jgi:hypothetical protein
VEEISEQIKQDDRDSWKGGNEDRKQAGHKSAFAA